MAATDLLVHFRADLGNTIGQFDAIDKRLNGLGAGASGIGARISGGIGAGITALSTAAVGAGAAIAGGLGLAVNAASSFEEQMSAVKAVSGATAEEMARLNALALKLGAETSFSASEAAAGFEELVKGGVPLEDILNGAADAMLNLAAAGGVPVATAAEIAANAMGIFGIKGSEMANVANQIAGAANASSLSVEDFQYSMAAVGAVADGAGQSFDDVATAIAVLGKNGLKGSDAGTSLKTMLLNLQPSTEKAADAMRDLGLYSLNTAKLTKVLGISAGSTVDQVNAASEAWARNEAALSGAKTGTKQWTTAYEKALGQLADMGSVSAFVNDDGTFKDMAEIAGILQDKLGDLDDASRTMALEEIFGQDAIRAANIFFKEGTSGFADMDEAMGKVTASDVAATRLDNLRGSLEQLKGSLETAGIAIGTVFLPVVRRIVDAITPIVNTVGPQIADFAQRVITEFQLMALAFDLGVLPQRLSNQFGKLYAYVAPQLAAFAGSIYAWITANAGPLVQRFAAWAAAMVEWIAPMIPPLLAQLGTVVQSIWGWIVAQAPGFLDKVLTWAEALTGWVATDVLPKLPGMLTAIGNAIADLLIALWPTIKEHAASIGTSLVEGIKSGLAAAWEGLKSYVASLLVGLPGPLLDFLGLDVGKLQAQAANAPRLPSMVGPGVVLPQPNVGVTVNLTQNKDGSFSANAQSDALGSRNLRLALRQQAGLGD